MKLFTRTLALLLAVVLTLGLLPAQVLADDFGDVFNGEPIDNGTYVYSISAMGATIQWCYDDSADIVIPDTIDGYPVVTIGSGAFESKSIVSVTIPDSVTTIGMNAFSNCTQLESVTIGIGVETVENCAFENCEWLRNVRYVGDRYQWEQISFGFGNDALLYAENLMFGPASEGGNGVIESIFVSFFPEEQRYLRYGQDLNTDGLELMLYYEDGSTEIVSEGYTVYGYDPHQWGMQMLAVEYEGMMTEDFLEVYVYLEGPCGDSLTYTFGPAGDLNIGGTGSMTDYTYPSDTPWYPYRDQITAIYVNEDVGSIGANAFYGACNIYTGFLDVTIPQSVTVIGDNAFYGAEGMYVNYRGSKADWAQISVGSGNEALLQSEIYYEIATPEWISVSQLPYKTEYAIGEELDVTGLELTAYYDDGSEYTVTDFYTVEGYDPNVWGWQSVTVSYEGLETWFEVYVSEPTPESLYIKNMPKTEYFLGEDLEYYDLTLEVVYSDGHTEEVFWDFSEGALWNYEVSGFDSTVLGEQVLTVSYAGLTTTYTVTVKDPAVTVVGSGSCGENALWALYADGRLVISGTGPMDNYDYLGVEHGKIAPWKAYCGGAEDSVFITAVEISDGITSVGDRTFDSNGELTKVTIADSVTYIGHASFANNSSLQTVVIPADVTFIGESAFDNCSLLSDLQLGESVTEIGYSAFGWCTNLTEVTLPDSVTTIGEWAFNNCTALTSITIPSSVTTIGAWAFDACSELTDVYYGGTAEQWEQIVIGSSNECLTGATVHYTEELEIIANGTCGDNLTWTLDSEGALIISGSGPMENFFSSGPAPWYDYGNGMNNDLVIRSVEIGDGITTIGAYAFLNCTMMTAASIPDSVTDIGRYAFSYCESLENVTIPENVTYIGVSAFQGSGITSVVIPEGVTTIEESTFNCCSSLTSITIPDSVKTIGKSAFLYCEGLPSIWIPESVTSIGRSAFFGCKSLTSVTIPGSLTSTGDRVFAMCTGLNSVEILDGVTTIGEDLFQACSGLYTIRIPASVTTIGKNAFDRCTALSSVDFDGTSEQWAQITIAEGNEPLSAATINCKELYVSYIYISTYPDKLSYLQGEELDITGLVLTVSYTDGSTKEITEGFDIWGHDPWMTGMQTITVSYQMYTTTFGVDVIPGGRCGDNLVWTFDEMYGILSISGTGAMYDFDYAPWASYKDRIRTLQLGDGMTTIGANAFYDHWCLTSPVDIPEGVTSIGSGAFYNTYMTAVTIPDGVESIGKDAFGWCGGLGELILPDSVREIGDYAFAWCNGVTKVKLSSQLTAINEGVFQGCVMLGSIEIPQSVTKIGDYAFESCGLKSFEIPAGVTEIGSGVFQGSQIEEITIPNGVTRIGENAFYMCDYLKSIALPSSLTEIGNHAFGQCGGLTSVTIPGSVTDMGEYIFYFCQALTEIIIEDGVTTIGNYAFVYTPALASVTIPASVTLIESYAFSGVDTLTDVYYGGTEAQWKQVVIEMDNGVLSRATIHFAEAGPEIIDNGTCGDNLTWTLDEEGTLTISGTGAMTDFASMEAPWYDYCSSIKAVNVGGGVTKIGSHAFIYCTALSSVTIPGNVRTIGESAFHNCTGLTSVTICDGVELIDDYAFYYTRLSSVTIPGSVKSVGRCAFALSALTSVTLCEGVEVIGIRTFEHCSGITEISIPSTVRQIGERAFFGNAVTTLTIPEGVTTLESYVFGNCKAMTSLYLPASLTSVADYAAYGCSGLTDVYFAGRKAQWNAIAFGYGNDYLTSTATLHCAMPSVVVDIAVATEPHRTAFFEGEPLDTTGLTLTALYDDGSTVQITEGFTVNGYDAYTAGEQRLTVSYAGYNALFYVTVMPIVATGIGIENMPYKHMYFVGDQLDTHGLTLVVSYNNGDTATVTEGFEVSGYDPYTTGEQCVTITYEGQSTYFYINVQPIVATYLYVDTMPHRMMYFVGDQLDTTGMSVTVNYNNGNVISLTEGFEITGYDPYVVGEQCVTITYEGQSTYFYVNVQPIMATYIYVDKMPDRTGYFVGDQLDTTGMSLMVTYNNGNVVSVTEGFEVMGYDPYMSGEQCVTVSYEGQTTYFNVMVSPIIVTHIGIDAMPNKTFYYVGEELDTTGMTLMVQYNNGNMIGVTEGYEVMGYDPYVTGEQCVTVTYEGLSTYFYVRVEPIVATYVGIVTLPDKTTYKVGEALDTSGMVLEVSYNNGVTTAVTEGYEVTGFDSTTPGIQTLTVTYEGFIATFEVTVEDPVKFEIVKQPESTEITAGFIANFTVEATDVVSYKWQYRRNDSKPWLDTTLPGYKTATLSVPALLARDGYQYRCILTGKDKKTLITDIAFLTVTDSIFITQQPMRQIVNVDSNATFTVAAEGAGLTYQWQYRKSDDDFWKVTGLPGNQTTTLTVPALLSRNGYQYLCAITDENGIKIQSKVAVLSTIGFTSQPTDQTVELDTDAVFKVAAKGQNLTYKWQYRKSTTGSWMSTSLPGFDTNTLTVKALLSRNGYQYRCGITDALGTLVYSEPATLNLRSGIEITTQPVSVSAAISKYVEFAVAATGDGLRYQWQYCKPYTSTWINTSLTGATTPTLTVQALKDRAGYQYRCVITDKNGLSVISDAATLTVKTELLIHTQPADQHVPIGENAVFSVSATGIGLTYQWQYHEPNKEWCNTTLPGFDTDTLVVTALKDRNNYRYRCVVTDANGNSKTSHIAVLTLDIPEAAVTITSQPTDQTVSLGANAVFALTATGEGLTYQWQYQKVGASSNWLSTSLPGATTDTLTVAALAGRNGYRYRCVITDAEGNTLISDSVTLTVNDPASAATITSQPADQTAAAGENVKFTVGVTGSGLTYQWQYCSGPDSSWQNTGLTGNKTKTLTVQALAGRNGYQYRCVITDANGHVINSDIVTLTVE